MATYELRAPLTDADVEQLQIGDLVYLSGPCFTCRSSSVTFFTSAKVATMGYIMHNLPWTPALKSALS